MLEFARAKLDQLCAAYKREHNVCGKSLGEVVLDAKSARGVEEDARVLRGYDRLDDVGEVIDVWKRLDAEQDVVEGLF